MFWEANRDRKDGVGNGDEQSLISVAWKGLASAGGMDEGENLLEYPGSQYANMREGMPS